MPNFGKIDQPIMEMLLFLNFSTINMADDTILDFINCRILLADEVQGPRCITMRNVVKIAQNVAVI